MTDEPTLTGHVAAALAPQPLFFQRSVHSDDPEIVMSAQVIVNAVTAFTTKATQLHQEVDR